MSDVQGRIVGSVAGLLAGIVIGLAFGGLGNVGQLRADLRQAHAAEQAAKNDTLAMYHLLQAKEHAPSRRAELARGEGTAVGPLAVADVALEVAIEEPPGPAVAEIPVREGWTVRETETYRGFYRNGKPVGYGTVFYPEGQVQADQWWSQAGELVAFTLYDRAGKETARFADGSFLWRGEAVAEREAFDGDRRAGLVARSVPWTAAEAWREAVTRGR